MPKRLFNIAVIRRREIERHAKHIGAADTEDFWRWPVAWCWHNAQSKDPVNALVNAITRMGGECPEPEAEELLQRARKARQRRRARPLGKFLGVTYEHRRICGITTFGPRMPPAMRREQDRMSKEARRRARGVQSREEYERNCLQRTKPWEAEGISRRTWYRRRRGTSVSAATPTPKNGGTNGTSVSRASSIYVSDTPVPPEKSSKGEFEGGTSLVLENGVLLTRRWIAARERLCGYRHSRWLPTEPCQTRKTRPPSTRVL